MQIRQLHADDIALPEILNLIRTSFAYMDEKIDPPSSMHRLTITDIANACSSGEVWSIGSPIHACMMLKLKPDALYLGKLATHEKLRNQGIGKHLIEHAVMRAQQLNKAILEIEVRIELTENHRFFESQGFNRIATKSHPGYSHSTYVVMHRPVSLNL